MAGIAAIGFLSPMLLLGLLALPILWWLLRAVPPAAIKRHFPAVTLLLGLKDPESTPDKTPWWLLALRITALAALIIGFAGPVLNPDTARPARGPLLILTDASWASGPDWQQRQERMAAALKEAGAGNRPVAVISLSGKINQNDPVPFRAARDWAEALPAIAPNPWAPDYAAFQTWLERQKSTRFETLWLSDGIARNGRTKLARALADRGRVTVFQSAAAVVALGPPAFKDGKISLLAQRSMPGRAGRATITAFGPDPNGINRRLATAVADFAPDAKTARVSFALPTELRNRIRQFSITGKRSAGAVVLSDDSLKRRKVALFAGQRGREGQALLTSLHFLKKALAPTADLIEASLNDSLQSDPDVVVLADVAKMTARETEALQKWVTGGGLLVRFAGPRMAARSRAESKADPLLPVRLRAGGRSVGGAMSWGAPKTLKPFTKGSPFFGLTIPADVTVTTQVLAQPDPSLSARTIAALQDGTPLVTQKDLGDGRIVLFHVTANAEWSSLPLSGLFVKMLERLAISTRAAAPVAADLVGQVWQPEQVMNGFGELRAADDMVAVPGKRLAKAGVAPDLPPGTYRNGDRQVAVNVMTKGQGLSLARWPSSVSVRTLQAPQEQPLMALFLALALGLLMLDILATLWLGGRLGGPRGGVIAALALVVLLPLPKAQAQTSADALALRATRDTVLAYVITGDTRLDKTSEAGLYGLSRVLTQRTAVEPADPIGIDLEKDELAFFPLIYWPISELQKIPSQAAYEKLNTYLQKGGMILFDTRDANLGRDGTGTPNRRRLQQLAAGLDIPALEPIPSDHVLTRSFYLLQDFPGRFAHSDVWVEAAPKDAVRTAGMPFRNLNDGVSPVVIGGNDWAAAWAQSRRGDYLFPIGRGDYAGQRQREMAYRFGINLVMYVLTGNYKSDQVHVPALLERLGQ